MPHYELLHGISVGESVVETVRPYTLKLSE